MGNESASPVSPSNQPEPSAVGQTANLGRATSIGGGAVKIFREFKWGLLTLFLLMVVVIGLVYDGGHKKKPGEADKPAKVAEVTPEINLDLGSEPAAPPVAPVTGAAAGTGSALPNPTGPVGAPTGPVIETVSPPALPPTTAPQQPEVRPTVGGNEKHPAGNTEPAATPASNDRQYTVKSGDTLTRIANTMLPGTKGSVKAILDANKDVLADPNKLRVGMTLKIPAAPAAEVRTTSNGPAKTDHATTSAPGKPEVAPAGNDANEYVVQSGDTLERIARKLFNDGRKWRDLYEWNREQLADPGHLRLGQTLKVKQAKVTSTPSASPVAPAATGSARAESTAPVTKKTTASKEVKEPKEHATPTVAKEDSPQVEVMSQTSPANMP